MSAMRILKLAVLFALAFIATACGLSNTMYNARAYFKSASERPLNSNGKPNPQAVDEYTKAIKKCGIVITEKKQGKTLEEALFIMAKALYLKGNSSFQAKDQFENLIKLNPQGKYVPEAHVFLAKVLREINKPDEAESLLERFIRDPGFKKDHPQALLTLADFEIQDKDYYRAQYWLEKIISEYPKTKLYRDAFFLFGKNYYVQKDYSRSLEEFGKLSKTRRIDKGLRLEAKYYIALNHYELGNYGAGEKVIRDVIDDEIRTEKLALAKVLRGRFLLRGKDPDKGKAELEAVTKDYPRSQASGYAAWYLAEYLFYIRGDRAAALSTYAKVRTEFPTLEFVSEAQSKIAALTQLNAGARLNSELATQQFLDYHYLAADNYFSPLNLPDSSFIIYNRVSSENDGLIARLDSLRILESAVTARIDSLKALLPLPARTEAKADSGSIEQTKDPADTLMITEVAVLPPDSSFAFADTLITARELIPADSSAVKNDSLVVKPAIDIEALQRQKTSAEAELTALQNRIDNLQKVITRFDTEVIPFVTFARANLYLKLNRKDPEIADLLSFMRESYPGNKYTNALGQLYAGDPVRIIDPELERQESLLESALGEPNPDSMLVQLQRLSSTTDPLIQLRANYRLAWYYAIQQADTTSARAYFDAVLKAQDGGEYALLTRKLYDGKKFLIYQQTAVRDSLVPDSLQVKDVSEPAVVLPDSLGGMGNSVVDSLFAPESGVQDSLKTLESSPPEAPTEPELQPEGTGTQVPGSEPLIKEETEPLPKPDEPNEENPLE